MGLVFRPGVSPTILTSGAIAARTARSIRQNTSNAKQITVINAAIRRFVFRNIGATASGPLNAE